MRNKSNQAGFEAVGAIVVLLFVLVVGVVGYKVLSMNKSDVATNAATTGSALYPSKLQTKSDLTQTSKALDDSNTQLDSDLNDTALDADMNAML